MKKILLILILSIYANANSNDLVIEKKIYEQFFSALSTKQKPQVYLDEPIESLHLQTEKFSIIDSCTEADIVIVTKNTIDEKCLKKIVFGTRYRHLKKDYVLGAFFWQKGRPNIVFKGTNLKSKGIQLPKALQEFVE